MQGLLPFTVAALTLSGEHDPPEVIDLQKSGSPRTHVDVLFVGDGYTRGQLAEGGKYRQDVDKYVTRFFEEWPFRWFQDRFNVRALLLESPQSGCDRSPAEERVATALESHFDRPSGRLLVFRENDRLAELARESGEVDIIFVMVNTSKYGGAGTVVNGLGVRGRPCPAPTFAVDAEDSFQIALHELGHSFARLADEYVSVSDQAAYPLPSRGNDLDFLNATVEGEFDRRSALALKNTLKWKHFLRLPGATEFPWLHEGGFYRESGVYRPWLRCKMRELKDPFCPVCTEGMAQAIVRACYGRWSDKVYHREHKLELWKEPAPR